MTLVAASSTSNSGVVGSTWVGKVNTAFTSQSITATLSVAKTSKVIHVRRFSGCGEALTGATGSGSTTASTTVSVSPGTTPAIGDLTVAQAYIEYGTALSVTYDTDTTGGSWATGNTVSIGTTAAGTACATQYKISTSSAAQTWNLTITSARRSYMIFNLKPATDAYITPGTVAAPGAAVPAPTFGAYPLRQSTGAIGSLSGSSIPAAYPATLTANDYLFLFVSCGDAAILDGIPSGWREVVSPAASAAVADTRVYWRRANGGELSNGVIAFTTGGTKGRAFMTAVTPPPGFDLAIIDTDVVYDTTNDTNLTLVSKNFTVAGMSDIAIAHVMASGTFTTSAWSGYSLLHSTATEDGGLDTWTSGRTGTNTLQHVAMSAEFATNGTGTLTAAVTGGAPNTNTQGVGIFIQLRAIESAQANITPATVRALGYVSTPSSTVAYVNAVAARGRGVR